MQSVVARYQRHMRPIARRRNASIPIKDPLSPGRRTIETESLEMAGSRCSSGAVHARLNASSN